MTTFPLNLDELAEEQALLALGPNDRVARVLKVYAGVKPLLTTLSVVPLLPATWRAGIVLFLQTLDALASTTGDATVEKEFKAGKDQAGKKQASKLTFRPIRKVARDARTGWFITRAEARRRPATTVVEMIKYPSRKQ